MAMDMDRFLDPNSGAAPQPGGSQGTGELQTPEEFRDQRRSDLIPPQPLQMAARREDQDEGTDVSAEEQDQALSGEGLRQAVPSSGPHPTATGATQPQPLAEVKHEAAEEKPLDRMTRNELLEEARKRGLQGVSSYSKADLLEALR